MHIAGGDWRFFYPENVKFFAQIPSAWDSSLNTGIGISALPTMWINSYLNFSASFSYLNLSWNMITVIFWILPPLILSLIGSYKLFSKFWGEKSKIYALVSSVIYISNTYILMVFSGGQFGIFFAYSIIPLLFVKFIELVEKPTKFNSIFFALIMGLIILFDPRIFVLGFLPLTLYAILKRRIVLKNYFYIFIIPLLLTLMLHSFWLLPLVIFRSNNNIHINYDTNSVAFFSFAFLENSISLLHPNWPDNIFGKVYFMRPEFIVLPILSVLGFLKTKSWNLKVSMVFMLLLISSFFAKGTNDPFGFIYFMFYKYIPGFSVFRDPTKFYILVALSYSLILPMSLSNIARFLVNVNFLSKKNAIAVAILFLIFWIALFYPLLNVKVKGIFTPRKIPNEYFYLKEKLSKDEDFYRTLWIPQWQRFGFFSDIHPAIGRGEIFSSSDIKKYLKELDTAFMEEKLKRLGVRYVVIPYDSESEIFYNRDKFDKNLFNRITSKVENISWLKEENRIGDLFIFSTENIYGRFFSNNPSSKLKIIDQSKTSYTLNISDVKKGDILSFSENYNPFWIMQVNGKTINSVKDKYGLNTFTLPQDNVNKLKIEFIPQKYVKVGLVISIFTFLFMVYQLLFKNTIKKI